MDVAIVTWGDAHYSIEDGRLDEIAHSPIITTTVGFLYKSDKVGVTVLHEIYEQEYRDEHKGYTFIPRHMVITEKILKVK